MTKNRGDEGKMFFFLRDEGVRRGSGGPSIGLGSGGCLGHGTSPSGTWLGSKSATWARRAVARFALGARLYPARRPSGERRAGEETPEFGIPDTSKPTSRD